MLPRLGRGPDGSWETIVGAPRVSTAADREFVSPGGGHTEVALPWPGRCSPPQYVRRCIIAVARVWSFRGVLEGEEGGGWRFPESRIWPAGVGFSNFNSCGS